MSNEQDLIMEARRYNEDNAEKVKQMINNKYKKLMGEDVEPIAEPTRLTFAEAQVKGDVVEMLKIKRGYYEKLDAEKELNELLENTDIVAVARELEGLGDKITEHKSVLDRAIENAKASIKAEYEQDIRENRARGNMREGYKEIALQAEYYKDIENIEDRESIRALRNELVQMQERRRMLSYAKEKFMIDNASLIAEEKKRVKLEQIKLAGLV